MRLVTSRAGLAQPEAERRVNEVVSRVKDDISRARKTGVIFAFMAGAAAMLFIDLERNPPSSIRDSLVCGGNAIRVRDSPQQDSLP